jgi:uncharacterized protein (DUF952 family)
MLIYKIFRRPEWDAFRAAGQTAGAPVDLADGYIHISPPPRRSPKPPRNGSPPKATSCWWPSKPTAGPALKWEPSRGGALFPHLYRSLRLSEVVWDKSLPLGATGHIFPEGVW